MTVFTPGHRWQTPFMPFKILIGITPLKNYKTAVYMNAKEKGNEQEEGVQITLELIEKIKAKQGVHGIHLMAVGWEDIVPRIVKEAGLATTK